MQTLKLTSILLLFISAAVAETLRNADVIQMVRAGRPVAEIVGRINAAESGFSMYDEDLLALRRANTPEVVIRAMFARQGGGRIELPRTEPATPVAAPRAVAPQSPPMSAPRAHVADMEQWSRLPVTWS